MDGENRMPENIPEEERELYFLAKIASERSQGRQIVTWGWSNIYPEIAQFNAVLKKYFSKSVAFGVFVHQGAIDNANAFPFARLQGNRSQYYVVSYADYNNINVGQLTRLQYRENDDFIFRHPKPVVMTGFDLANNRYEDERGNVVEGEFGKVGKIVLRGGNNRICLYGKNRGLEKLTLATSSNFLVKIGNGGGGVNFQEVMLIRSFRSVGIAELSIGQNCRFCNGLFSVIPALACSSCVLDEGSTFETNLRIGANAGKKLKIGRDCMFSHDCFVLCGDGHSVFDVETDKNINSIYETQTERQNKLVIGDHVWVGRGATLLHGTNIGSGSIVGAMSVVKGVYPNNCAIRGNPAVIGRKNVAWSRANMAENPALCIRPEYYRKTEDI